MEREVVAQIFVRDELIEVYGDEGAYPCTRPASHLARDHAALAELLAQVREHEARRKRLTKAERAEQLAGAAARARAELEAEKAAQAAVEARRRASAAALSIP